MDVIEMLSELEEIIEKGFEIPIVKKTFIDKEKVMELINDISLQLPDELRVAKSIAEDSKKIIADAKIKEAEHKIMALVDEHEITKQATANANDIISKAQKDGREIKLAAIKFADDLLERVETDVKSINEKVRQGRESLRQ